MKQSITLLLLLFAGWAQAQSPIGAWHATLLDDQGQDIQSVVIFADGYQVNTYYDFDGNFLSTNGGTWRLDGDFMTETVEFDSGKPERVGGSVRFRIAVTETSLSIIDGPRWARIDSGSPGALAGAWLMSGRKQNDIITERDTSGPRKTMKILSGTRFQWIAYNTETKEFMGTGGGTYTTQNGKYTENIAFFSRDISRVGASLEFNYELKEGKWHHSGLSSKGEPMYEIWSLR